MSVTCGFFNSINSDRRYDAHQIGGVFHGLLLDGVLSSIGNGFACQKVTDTTIKIRSGFGYFGGYYVCNSEEIEYEIDDDVYPELPITSIRIAEGSVQTEYPYSGRLDLGDIKIEAIGEDYEPTRLGDCYIVIYRDDINRKFVIEAISTWDYDSSKHYIIALCNRSVTGLTVTNLVGRISGELIGAPLITGITQKAYIDDIMDYISSAETTFESSWDTEKSEFWTNWLTKNEYYLYHRTASQYSRFNTELSSKEVKPLMIKATIERGSTGMQIDYEEDFPDGSVVDIKTDNYDFILNNVVIEGRTITLTYEAASGKFDILIIIR